MANAWCITTVLWWNTLKTRAFRQSLWHHGERGKKKTQHHGNKIKLFHIWLWLSLKIPCQHHGECLHVCRHLTNSAQVNLSQECYVHNSENSTKKRLSHTCLWQSEYSMLTLWWKVPFMCWQTPQKGTAVNLSQECHVHNTASGIMKRLPHSVCDCIGIPPANTITKDSLCVLTNTSQWCCGETVSRTPYSQCRKCLDEKVITHVTVSHANTTVKGVVYVLTAVLLPAGESSCKSCRCVEEFVSEVSDEMWLSEDRTSGVGW